MEIENTFIEGLKIVHLNKISDNRGSFTKMFNEDIFKSNNLRIDIKESYFSVSDQHVIRGMHFQSPPAEHSKLVFVNKGSIIDVVLDIRKNSATFGQYFTTTVSEDKPKLIYIPVGCAHGFLSLKDHTIVSYMQTSVYNKECDHGIHYNSFNFDWGVKVPILSARDEAFVTLKDCKNLF